MFDLAPACAEMSRLVSGVAADQLVWPTPCADWTVAELLAHIHQFSTVFTDNAHKRPTRPPSTLVDDWRHAIPVQIDELAVAWRGDAAWQGRASAGGVEMDAPDNAVVAIEELTTHGWDLARATGQQFRTDDECLDQVDQFFVIFAPRTDEGEGPFGPTAEPADDASRLDRTIARTGRDPRWQSPLA